MHQPARPPESSAASEALLAQAERLQLVLESVEAGMYDVDLATGQVRCSARFCEIFGLDPVAARVTSLAAFQALLDPDDDRAMEDAARQALVADRSWSRIGRIRRASDGAARTVHVYGRTLLDADGTPVRSIGTVRDATEEQAAARAVAEGMRQLAEAQRVAGIGSWEWDIATNTVGWSEQTYRLLGFDPATTTPSFERVLEVAYDDAGKAAYLAAVQDALTGDRPYDLETRIRRKDGSVRYFHVRGEVVRAPDGTPRRMVGTMEDVTERRADARALAERESLLRTLAESSPMGIYLTDAATSKVTYANARLLDLWSMSLEEFSTSWTTRVHPEDRGVFDADRARLAQLDGPARYAYRILVGDRLSHVRVTSAPVRDAMGTVAGQVGLVEDVTLEVEAIAERERLEVQVRQAQKLESIGLLAGGIAHDFNNLLVGILGTTSQALVELPSASPTRPLLEDVLVAAERAADLTRQLLAYAGRGRLVVEPLALSELVGRMQGIFRSVVARRARFELHLEDGLAPVRGDATQLRQVILNLVTNAVEALRDEQGLVTVRTFVAGRDAVRDATMHFGETGNRDAWVAVEVRDTGVGMDAVTLGRIFEPFFSTKFTGRGLGLAATQGIVRSHGGVIAVHSAPGEGSRFTLLLPPSDEALPDDAVRVERPVPAVSPGGRLLVVDDDAMVRRVLINLLARRGYAVDEAENGVEAIRAVKEGPARYRAVLLDLTMPVLGGEAAFRAIRALAPTLPVVLMSGYSDGARIGEEVMAGVAMMLAKPFTATDLEFALARAIAADVS